MLQAFDKYSTLYDEHFTNSLIGKVQRQQVYSALSKVIENKETVLELNCGTGEDAIWFYNKNKKILATDVSKGMIDVASNKKSGIDFKIININNINILMPQKFELIFSNFGGLNCLTKNELIQLAINSNNLQDINSRLVFVIMSSSCWWEKLYYTLKKDRLSAHRRSRKEGVETTIDNVKFKTYYYSPKEMTTIFSTYYKLHHVKPIGFFVPPSYLEGYFKKHSLLLKTLKLLDEIACKFSFLSNYADHYILILDKK